MRKEHPTNIIYDVSEKMRTIHAIVKSIQTEIFSTDDEQNARMIELGITGDYSDKELRQLRFSTLPDWQKKYMTHKITEHNHESFCQLLKTNIEMIIEMCKIAEPKTDITIKRREESETLQKRFDKPLSNPKPLLTDLMESYDLLTKDKNLSTQEREGRTLSIIEHLKDVEMAIINPNQQYTNDSMPIKKVKKTTIERLWSNLMDKLKNK